MANAHLDFTDKKYLSVEAAEFFSGPLCITFQLTRLTCFDLLWVKISRTPPRLVIAVARSQQGINLHSRAEGAMAVMISCNLPCIEYQACFIQIMPCCPRFFQLADFVLGFLILSLSGQCESSCLILKKISLF